MWVRSQGARRPEKGLLRRASRSAIAIDVDTRGDASGRPRFESGGIEVADDRND